MDLYKNSSDHYLPGARPWPGLAYYITCGLSRIEHSRDTGTNSQQISAAPALTDLTVHLVMF